MGTCDLVGSLQALPEADPVEIGGIQFGAVITCGCVCQLQTRMTVYTICEIMFSC